MVPHTVVVDFAVALLLTSVGCDLLGGAAEEDDLHIVALWTLLFGAGAAALSVLSGYAAADAVEPTGDALQTVLWHRNTAIATLVGALPLAAWRFRAGAAPPTHGAYWLLTVFTIGSLLVTAYLGGSSVFRYGVGVGVGI